MDTEFERRATHLESVISANTNAIKRLTRMFDGDPDMGAGLRTRVEDVEKKVDGFVEEWREYKVERRHQSAMEKERYKYLLIGLGLNLAGLGTFATLILRALGVSP